MTRVLQVIPEMHLGGAEAIAAELALSEEWISGIASSGGARIEALIAAGHVARYQAPLARRSPGHLVASVYAVNAAIREFEPRVLIAHNVRATFVAGVASRLRGPRKHVPIISVLHGIAPEDYPSAVKVFRRASTTVVAVSQSVHDRLVLAGLPAEAITLIPNGISPPKLIPKLEARRQLQIPEDITVALCLARIVPPKRHDILMHAWARFGEDALLLVAGDGVQRPQVESLAGELGTSDTVRFLGFRRDTGRLLSASDINVLVSDREGFPVSVLEAYAAGIPTIASKVDGLVDVVTSETGILIPHNEPDTFTTAIRTLHQDVRLRAKLGEGAAVKFMGMYSADQMRRDYNTLVRKVAATGES